MIYGVARRDAMVAAGGSKDVLAPDRLVLARLVLQGTILRTGGFLYLRRRNRPAETPDGARLRQLADLNPATAAERTAMPAPRLFRALRDLHLQAVRESSLSFSEKLDARIATLACFHMRFHVASNRVRVQKGLAIATRQTPRLDRSW